MCWEALGWMKQNPTSHWIGHEDRCWVFRLGGPRLVICRWLILRPGHVSDTLLLLPLCAGSRDSRRSRRLNLLSRLQRNRKWVSLPAALAQKWRQFSQKFPANLPTNLIVRVSHTPTSDHHQGRWVTLTPTKPWSEEVGDMGHTPEPNQFSLEGQRAGNQERLLRPITPQTFLRFSPSTSNILCLLRIENGENTDGGKKPTTEKTAL